MGRMNKERFYALVPSGEIRHITVEKVGKATMTLSRPAKPGRGGIWLVKGKNGTD